MMKIDGRLRIVAKMRCERYKFPKSAAEHTPGTYAIVICTVIEVIEGTIPAMAYLPGTNEVALVGKLDRMYKKGEYMITAALEEDRVWGYRYHCIEMNAPYNFESVEDQRKFLSMFLSSTVIERLFASYHNPIDLLKNKNISKLCAIKGIGTKTAYKLCEKYAENTNNARAYVELQDLDLTKNAIDKIVSSIGSVDVAIDTIKSNPYSLISLVRGYGWEKADKIALKRGFGTDSPERCIAFATFMLSKEGHEEGNSKMPIDELLYSMIQMCAPVTQENAAAYLREHTVGITEFENLFQKAINNEPFVPPLFFYSKDTQDIGLFNWRLLERKIANQLEKLKNAPQNIKYDEEVCKNIIAKTEKKIGFSYTVEQNKAIWTILNNNVSILTGRAGTGKSSVLAPLVKIFEYYGLKVAQCALSGRASSLLTSYTGLEGQTIHRLLHFTPETEAFKFTEDNPLDYDVVIIDETSMVGQDLFLSLIQTIRPGAKLVMLGDVKQLPPLDVGNILYDCIKSNYIPTVTLTVIQRQALRSGIISESNQVCEGKSLVKTDFSGSEIRGELQDFKIVCNDDPAISHTKVIEEFKKLYVEQHIPIDDIQIVVPVRVKGNNSCRCFNQEIQALVNNNTKAKGVSYLINDAGFEYTVTFKINDRVIITKNNYRTETITGEQTAVFNGNMGHIIDIDENKMVIAIQDGDTVVLPRDRWYDVNLAYACTCHKLQGSQAPYVIISLDGSAYPLLMREWLYTAITRAKQYCILVGQPRAINTATRVSNIKVKQTWLKNDLEKLYQANYLASISNKGE